MTCGRLVAQAQQMILANQMQEWTKSLVKNIPDTYVWVVFDKGSWPEIVRENGCMIELLEDWIYHLWSKERDYLIKYHLNQGKV